ncbi:MAG: RNA polymerase sigma factor, partial [Cytophagales bacterium]|nr:RNA polymerase sigma factor [Cytophagales bacterium]
MKNIVDGCLKGNPGSQHQLYKLLASKLMAVCMRYVKNRQEAEDCLQESFIKIFASLTEYKNDGVIEAWARRITVNTLINHLNLTKRFEGNQELETAESYLDAGIDINSDLETKDLYIIINQLPDLYKNIFNLHAIEGYSHKEISELIGINESTSRTYLTRAKQMLVKIHTNINNRHERIS